MKESNFERMDRFRDVLRAIAMSAESLGAAWAKEKAEAVLKRDNDIAESHRKSIQKGSTK